MTSSLIFFITFFDIGGGGVPKKRKENNQLAAVSSRAKLNQKYCPSLLQAFCYWKQILLHILMKLKHILFRGTKSISE